LALVFLWQMIGRVIMENAATTMATKTVVKMITVKTVTETITAIIMDIDQSLAMIIINMSISTIIIIMVIGIRGIHGNTIKEKTPTILDMGVTKDITTNCFSCLMTASMRLCSRSADSAGFFQRLK